MVKVTVDIGDCYWLAKPLTAIEKLASEDDTNIDDISSLTEAAEDAGCKCNQNIPPMDDENLVDKTLQRIKSLEDRVNNLKSSQQS
ncbi:hypothetical protein [Okeania sp. KiyG1]|uniref:hypothetical protein n=1 Tax=Okeania sp. KiyG1 TaxID=2720165 RepID=UPI0019240B6C|nr:hypothetical protein [Okeania sp. KiyG1]GGA57037.1 hypothetical protein CYANOKiyG1_78020 [Okeania sp. KiyG1]